MIPNRWVGHATACAAVSPPGESGSPKHMEHPTPGKSWLTHYPTEYVRTNSMIKFCGLSLKLPQTFGQVTYEESSLCFRDFTAFTEHRFRGLNRTGSGRLLGCRKFLTRLSKMDPDPQYGGFRFVMGVPPVLILFSLLFSHGNKPNPASCSWGSSIQPVDRSLDWILRSEFSATGNQDLVNQIASGYD